MALLACHVLAWLSRRTVSVRCERVCCNFLLEVRVIDFANFADRGHDAVLPVPYNFEGSSCADHIKRACYKLSIGGPVLILSHGA
ncbi:MAG: hypothetical protein RLZZ369_2006 [Pseudomonadota bacterium]